MFIVNQFPENQAPIGAAYFGRQATREHMPLLTGLENNVAARRFYKHGAPNGAFAGQRPPSPIGWEREGVRASDAATIFIS